MLNIVFFAVLLWARDSSPGPQEDDNATEQPASPPRKARLGDRRGGAGASAHLLREG